MAPYKNKERRMFEFLEIADLSNKQFTHFLESAHYRQLIYNCSDLKKIDVPQLKALLENEPTKIEWTPVRQYAEKILKRSDERGWGFTKSDVMDFDSKLSIHSNSLRPIGVDIWLGKDLEINWSEAISWLSDEVSALSYDLQIYFKPSQVSFMPNCEKKGRKSLNEVGLDLATFWDPICGISPFKIKKTKPIWPGLEIVWLLALNPQVFINMDGLNIPYLIVPGLSIDSVCLPCFYNDSNVHKVHAFCDWNDGRQWKSASMVTFDEAFQ